MTLCSFQPLLTYLIHRESAQEAGGGHGEAMVLDRTHHVRGARGSDGRSLGRR